MSREFQQALQLHQQGKYPEAAVIYGRVLRAQPRHFDALHLLGVLHLQSGRAQTALEYIERALRVNAGEAIVHANRGSALANLGRAEAALESYDRALQLKPDLIGILNNRAVTLLGLKRFEEAATAFSRLLEAAPAYDFALGSLLQSQLYCCDWASHASTVARVLESVDAGLPAARPFVMLAATDSAETQLKCARAYVAGRHPASDQPLWRGERYRHSKICVGYVSGDFRDHAVSMLAAGLFEKHDRERFEVIGISLAAAQNTPLATRVTASFTRLLDVTQLSDAQAAAQIRDQEVDILVDLMGYTRGCRPDIFARRPAPVQVTYLGYPGTMGAPYMDYLLADDFVIPEDSRVHYAERVVCLPHCFQVNDDSRFMDPVPSREAAGLPPSGLVFCSFNSSHKLNPVFFGVWMRLLAAVPDSVLWLLGEAPAVRANLRSESAARGIDPERLIFAERLPYAAHLARLALADLFLDSIPFSGGATVSDALWVGVPVVTCAGRALASRMAGSLMRAVGLIEGITDSVEAYEALVLQMAASPSRLTEWRERLAQARRDSPLFDTNLFRRHLECAYSAMWERTQRGEEPESFDVLPLEAPGAP